MIAKSAEDVDVSGRDIVVIECSGVRQVHVSKKDCHQIIKGLKSSALMFVDDIDVTSELKGLPVSLLNDADRLSKSLWLFLGLDALPSLDLNSLALILGLGIFHELIFKE